MKFLKEIASRFYAREGQNISEMCFVFPGRRAGLFFQKSLGEVADKPLFSPAILTINDLFTRLSGYRVADRLDVLFRLYRIYIGLSGSKESFDEFMFWGEIVLADFDDVDKYLVNPQKLFANIKDLKDIDSDYSFLTENQMEAVKSFWTSFLPSDSSEKKLKFKSLWEILYPLYIALREDLEKDGCGYEGMIYRKIAESLISQKDGNLSYIHEKLGGYREIVFVGFNAVNNCEKLLMSSLKKQGKADFYWDFCGDMITDVNNKASLFMRDNIINFPSKEDIDFSVDYKPEIEIIGVPSSAGEVKIAGELINLCGGGINTAVVLPDESLLTPLLHSVDEGAGSINVTMGYPLREGSIVSLVESFIELQKGPLYFRRVLPVLRHGYIKLISGNDAQRAENEIIKGNIIYVSQELFRESELLQMIFRKVTDDKAAPEENIDKLSVYLHSVLDYIIQKIDITRVEKEFVYYLYTFITRLGDLHIPMSIDTYLRLFRQLVNSTSIPFRGEPLSGLQIMGVLETRCLDFDNLIICSMNDGVFPTRSGSNSFIPHNLRKGFALPDYEYRDGVTAYHFYRSIYRAKKLFLLYDTRTEGLVTGEQSRFIMQLKYHYKVPLKEKIATYRIEKRAREKIEVVKDSGVMSLLENNYLSRNKFLSASALNTYVKCPLWFYFKYVRRVEEEEEVSESVEANTFGTIFHKSMENLYLPYVNKVISKALLTELIRSKDKIENTVESAFCEIQKVKEIKGHNLLVEKLIVRYVEKTLEYDITIAPFRYVSSEQTLKKEFALDSERSIMFKAIIDRTDERDGILRIVDYKTGKGPDRYNDLSDLFDSESKKKYDVTRQMFLYAYMCGKKENLITAPYLLREIVKGNSNEELVTPEMTDVFEDLLRTKVLEIFDKTVPFVQTEIVERCEFCPFNVICR
ncbi:MAG: hypothetical protein H6Q22_612 [Bacteroidetes bacterium]|nr:hypothetical protein [Bacteroidota bacterium]